MSYSGLLSMLLHRGERKLFFLALVLFGGCVLTWQVILPEEKEPPTQSRELPPPAEWIPWRQETPFFLEKLPVEGIGNPFQASFPLPKPAVQAAVQPPAQEKPAQTETTAPQPPAQRRIAVTYRALRKALTGKTYAQLEISDSEKGGQTLWLQPGATLDCGVQICAITEKALLLSTPEGEDAGTIGYGKTRVFTLERK